MRFYRSPAVSAWQARSNAPTRMSRFFIGHGEIPMTRIFLIGLAAMTIEALGAMVKNDLAKWGPIIKAVIKN